MTIERSTLGTADGYGAQAEAWVAVATVWAEVRMLTGSEGWKAKQVQPEATVQVLIRHWSDFTSADRFRFGDRYLYPLSVVPDIRNTELRCLCGEKL